MHHALDLNPRDRNTKGLPCPTTYWPTCRCGQWVGIPAKRLGTAEGQYRAHLKVVDRERVRSTRRRKGRRVGAPAPQPCTPQHLLPEALRGHAVT